MPSNFLQDIGVSPNAFASPAQQPPQTTQPQSAPPQPYPEMDNDLLTLESRNEIDQLPGWDTATKRDRDLWLQSFVRAKSRRQPQNLTEYVDFVLNLTDVTGSPVTRANIANWAKERAIEYMPLPIKEEYQRKKQMREAMKVNQMAAQSQIDSMERIRQYVEQHPELKGKYKVQGGTVMDLTGNDEMKQAEQAKKQAEQAKKSLQDEIDRKIKMAKEAYADSEEGSKDEKYWKSELQKLRKQAYGAGDMQDTSDVEKQWNISFE